MIDIIGTITLYDDEGQATETLPGYHVNIAEEAMTEALEPYRVAPVLPVRIFAGDEPPWPMTAFLRFADEDEAVELLAEKAVERVCRAP